MTRGAGQRTVPAHHRFERHAVQQLHHEVERLVVGHAEVVQLDRVRRPQAGHGLGLAPEALDRELRRLAAARADHLGPDQLDRGRPGEHAMGRPVHLPHAAAPQQLARAGSSPSRAPWRPAGPAASRRARSPPRRPPSGSRDSASAARCSWDRSPTSPRALAIIMPSGFMDTAMSPAIRVLRGVFGTIAAKINVMTPFHVIRGDMTHPGGDRLPVHDQTEGEPREHHVPKSEIERPLRVPVALARTDPQREGDERAHDADGVRPVEVQPARGPHAT